MVKYRKRKNASATGVPWDVCPRAEGTRQWDMGFLAAWYKHQPPTGYSSHSAGNGKGWAHLGLIRDPGKVKPSQGGRRGHGVDRRTGPVTGLQTLAQNPQRQICRAAYGFFSPLKPMMTLNHVSAPVSHRVSLHAQEPPVLRDEGALHPQAGLGFHVFLLNV